MHPTTLNSNHHFGLSLNKTIFTTFLQLLTITFVLSFTCRPCAGLPIIPDGIKANHWINSTETSVATHNVALVNTTEWAGYREAASTGGWFTHPGIGRVGAGRGRFLPVGARMAVGRERNTTMDKEV